MNHLNEDIILHILKHLWFIHTTSWDQEFRPEAHRRYFANYSLISREWTMAAQRYVYQSAYITWNTHWLSFEAGVKSQIRGASLRAAIRIMDVSLSNSKLGFPVGLLHVILSYCPHLVELRLRIGPEVNNLFLRPNQEANLRAVFVELRPTLRGLQMSLDGKGKKLMVWEQILSLIPLESLDFVTFICPNRFPDPNTFDKKKWDVRRSLYSRFHWPLETNSCDLSLGVMLAARELQRQRQANDDADSPIPHSPLLVHPSTLRVYTDRIGAGMPEFVQFLGPYLDTILFQGALRSVRWTPQCKLVATCCPNLQRMLILDCFTEGPHPPHSEEYPVSRLYVLERRDWITSHSSVYNNHEQSDMLPDGLDAILAESEEEEQTGTTLKDGDLIETASHIVIFGGGDCEHHIRPVYRKPTVFEERWPSEAFGARKETRSSKALAKSFAYYWSEPLMQLPVHILVAIRRPATTPALWED